MRKLYIDGMLFADIGQKVIVIKDINEQLYLISNDVYIAYLAKSAFYKIFSPFEPYSILYHHFYGAGQVIPSDKSAISASILFFGENRLFDLTEDVLNIDDFDFNTTIQEVKDEQE